MRRNKVDIITLGCSKNLVDSERLMRQFAASGYITEHDPGKVNGEIVVINTCGFIGQAREESIRMILDMGEAKKKGIIGRLYVMGCLSERFRKELEDELPEVDRFYGKFNWADLLTDIGKSFNASISTERVLTTPRHYAYLKISEGCDRTCAYCSIPIMTGRHRSRPADEIVEEVRLLVKKGVKEFLLIAQDLTYYGIDTCKRPVLGELVRRISDVPGVEWIRLHYAYPSVNFPFDILDIIRERSNVCNYLDLALQHISDPVLKKMRRNITSAQTYDLLARIRDISPGIHLRTTLMVGHPGETARDFEELLGFVEKARFERMGAFMYSNEEGTYSFNNYKDDIDEKTKQSRLDALMSLQEGISASINREKTGKILKVIIDREEDSHYAGRTEYDSPEVDNEVFVSKDSRLVTGDFYKVCVKKTDTFDLYGEAIIS